MSACGRDAANLLFVNPLLDGWEADAELQRCVAKLQQILVLLRRFALLPHRSEILQPVQGAVNTLNCRHRLNFRDENLEEQSRGTIRTRTAHRLWEQSCCCGD